MLCMHACMIIIGSHASSQLFCTSNYTPPPPPPARGHPRHLQACVSSCTQCRMYKSDIYYSQQPSLCLRPKQAQTLLGSVDYGSVLTVAQILQQSHAHLRSSYNQAPCLSIILSPSKHLVLFSRSVGLWLGHISWGKVPIRRIRIAQKTRLPTREFSRPCAMKLYDLMTFFHIVLCRRLKEPGGRREIS